MRAHATNDRKSHPQTFHFLLWRNVSRPGTRGVGSHINHIGPFIGHALGSLTDFINTRRATAGIKGIGRHIKNSHHPRLLKRKEFTPCIDRKLLAICHAAL